ncbi:MAG TPA: aminotransferase class V-fold PLP-dependent enzyme [Candidatus Acidoferrales bacterium]|nr:aminotransferase class V-fold PLP-dependent enzyme [Candidatus Acidoferrales bacterium]
MKQDAGERNMPEAKLLDLTPGARKELWQGLARVIEEYIKGVAALPVDANPSAKDVRAFLATCDFARPMDPQAALAFAAKGLTKFQTHTPHPRYYGLFNPAPATMGIVADALVAAFNPQMAAWKHNPFGVEVERHLIRALGGRFGYEAAKADGVFCAGGSEANHTALLTALTNAFPEFHRTGARGLAAQPVFYVSAESHHSFHKAARMCGLGSVAVRDVAVDEKLRMSPEALAKAIAEDRRAGHLPFLVVATAGTTNAGAIDPIRPLAEIAAREKMWFHVDAAWGGAAALVPEMRRHLDGIELGDSITLDAHKWLSVPMGSGIYITRHSDILNRTFRIAAAYVPPKAEGEAIFDYYENSMQWSRRFIGFKLFLSLAVAGWDGYAAVLRGMTAIGEELRRQLVAAGWKIVNDTPLPIVCFVDSRSPHGATREYLDEIVREVVESGVAWISATRLRGTEPALRACITNYRTSAEDIRLLVAALEKARGKLQGKRISLPA